MSKLPKINRITHIFSVTTKPLASLFVEDLTGRDVPVMDRHNTEPNVAYLRERTDLLLILVLVYAESTFDQAEMVRKTYRHVLDFYPITDQLRESLEREIDQAGSPT